MKFKTSVEVLEMDMALNVIEEIREQNKPLADALQKLAKEYRFDNIVEASGSKLTKMIHAFIHDILILDDTPENLSVLRQIRMRGVDWMKKSLMSRVITGFFVILMSLAAIGAPSVVFAGNKDTQSAGTAAATDTLTFLSTDIPPFGALKDGKPVGFAVEILHEIMQRLGRADIIEFDEWDVAYKRALTEPNTVLWPPSRTPEREELLVGGTADPGEDRPVRPQGFRSGCQFSRGRKKDWRHRDGNGLRFRKAAQAKRVQQPGEPAQSNTGP